MAKESTIRIGSLADEGQGVPVFKEIGTASFTTTGTTVEVSTSLTSILSVVAIPKAVAPGAGEQLGSDGTITSGAVTIGRQTGTTSGLTFYYELTGKKE